MTYELFQPDGTCNRVLPLNPLRHRLLFYRIQVFELTLKLQDYVSQVPDDYLDHGAHVDRDTKTMRLGLPVSHLFPSLRQKYAELRLDKDGQLPIKFGLDDIYLPYDPKTTDANAVVPIQISADRAKSGTISVGGSSVPISVDQRKILADRGEVFIRGDQQVLRVALFPDPPAVASEDTPVAARSFFAYKPVSGPTATPRVRQPGHRGRHLPSYEIGLFTSYEQLWDLKGYSRGSLVNAITLAPSEELSIEVFTWDRLKTEEERSQSTETEQNIETSSLARLSTHVASDLSETTDTSGDVGLGVTLPVQGVPVKVARLRPGDWNGMLPRQR